MKKKIILFFNRPLPLLILLIYVGSYISVYPMIVSHSDPKSTRISFWEEKEVRARSRHKGKNTSHKHTRVMADVYFYLTLGLMTSNFLREILRFRPAP